VKGLLGLRALASKTFLAYLPDGSVPPPLAWALLCREAKQIPEHVTVVDDLFRGHSANLTTCKMCGNLSVTCEEWVAIELQLHNPHSSKARSKAASLSQLQNKQSAPLLLSSKDVSPPQPSTSITGRYLVGGSDQGQSLVISEARRQGLKAHSRDSESGTYSDIEGDVPGLDGLYVPSLLPSKELSHAESHEDGTISLNQSLDMVCSQHELKVEDGTGYECSHCSHPPIPGPSSLGAQPLSGAGGESNKAGPTKQLRAAK